MQIITIAGNIGKDAETRSLSSGDTVTGFSVAAKNGKDKPPTWFDCSIWGKRGTALCQYLTKGSSVTVSGTLTQREHEGKTYLGVRVNEIALHGGRNQSDERPARQDYQKPQEPGQDFDLDDDIPF